MDFFEQVARQVRDVYAKLTFSQKIAFVLLVALVVAVLVMFTSWGSQADYVRVTASPLGAARSEIITALESANVRYRFVGGTLEVVDPQYHEAMAILAQSGVVPGDALDLHMEDISKDDGFVRTSIDKWHQRILMVQEFLGKVISRMEGIRAATVVISTPRDGDYILGDEKGTAAVTVWLKGGVERLTPDQVTGIAALVAGGVRSIPKGNVNIVDNYLRAYGVRTDEADTVGTTGVGDRQELVMNCERKIARSIERMLSFYNPVRALVKVDMDFKRTESTVQEVDEEKVVPVKTTSSVEKESTTTPASPLGVDTPGVPVAATSAAGPNTKSSKEEKTNDYEIYKKVTTMADPPGDITNLSVSVLVPRDQVIEQIKAREEGMDDKAAAAKVDQELDSVRELVMSGLGITEQTKITVKAVTFPKPSIPQEVVVSGLAAYWEGHGAATVLGVLSLMALFLLWRMVKKPVEVVAPGTRGPGPAHEEEDLLAGMEGADIKAQRAQRLEREVEGMIRKSPREAANLITRWAQIEG